MLAIFAANYVVRSASHVWRSVRSSERNVQPALLSEARNHSKILSKHVSFHILELGHIFSSRLRVQCCGKKRLIFCFHSSFSLFLLLFRRWDSLHVIYIDKFHPRTKKDPDSDTKCPTHKKAPIRIHKRSNTERKDSEERIFARQKRNSPGDKQ